MKPYPFLFLLMVLIILVACSQTGDSENLTATSGAAEQAAPNVDAEVIPATSPPEPVPTETLAAENQALEGPTKAPPPAATITPAPIESTLAPIEVTYFTPAQGEGPYYTVDKPNDKDNDLTVLDGVAGIPVGQIVEFGGKVYDATGMPIPGAVVEIWQTDNNGVYLHPNDPGTDQRDRNFQFYGEAITTDDGSYNFRTILPGHYEPRPRHIHVKVKVEGNELLTTQFYFEGDPELESETMFNQAGSDGVHLIVGLVEGQDTNGNLILMGNRDIILDVDLSD